MFIDPDGRVIRIHYQDASGANKYYDYKPGAKTTIDNAYVQNSVASLNHLRQHDEGFGNSSKNLIDQLSYARSRVDLKDTKALPNTVTKSNQQADVNWNPNTAVNLVDNSMNPTGDAQSPATILLHELDHVKDAFTNITQFATDANTLTGDDYENVADKRTIQGLETSVANYFGEGTRTNHYIGTTFYTKDPTSTQETLIDNSLNQGQTLDVKPQQNSYSWGF